MSMLRPQISKLHLYQTRNAQVKFEYFSDEDKSIKQNLTPALMNLHMRSRDLVFS